MRWLRGYLVLLLIATLPGRALAQIESAAVTFEYVSKKAEERARAPFHSPKGELPEFLRPEHLNYDQYREIQFRHEKALWAAKKLPFRIEFFHPGYLYQELVKLNEFTPKYVQPIRFAQDFFDYRNLPMKERISTSLGYAGFRILYPLNLPDKMDELGAVIGASYFRLLGKNQNYGQSARGLAVDCGEPDRTEEWPLFTDWWLGEPEPGDMELHLFAVLDGVSCTGAYEFRIRPGATTVAEINAVLFFREEDKAHAANPQWQPLKTIGLAPLTSMYWLGKNSARKFDDYRPEVHDTDGLLIHLENGRSSGVRWITRPRGATRFSPPAMSAASACCNGTVILPATRTCLITTSGSLVFGSSRGINGGMARCICWN